MVFMTVKKPFWWVLIITGCMSMLGLLFLVCLGYFVRPGADDLYYTTFDGSEPHFTYHFLNGRITSIILYGLLYQVPHSLQLIPLISFSILFVSLFVLIRAIIRPHLPPNQLIFSTLSSTALLAIATSILLPGLYVSLYWFAAIPVHTWSICLSLLYLGLAIEYSRQPNQPLWKLVSIFFVGAIVVGCLGEFAATTLFLVACGFIGRSFIRKHTASFKIGLILLLSSLTSLAVLFFSPGAISRRQRVDSANPQGTLDLIAQLPHVIWQNIQLTPRLLDNWHVLIALILVVAILIALSPLTKNISLKTALLTTLVVGAISVAYELMCIAVIWIGLHEPQPLRSYFSTTIALILLAATVGVLLGIAIKHRWQPDIRLSPRLLSIGASLAVLISGAFYVPYLANFGANTIARAQAWDNRSKLIDGPVRQSLCEIPINPLPIKGMWVESADSSYWVNQSLAIYYGLPCNPHTNNQFWDQYVPLG